MQHVRVEISEPVLDAGGDHDRLVGQQDCDIVADGDLGAAADHLENLFHGVDVDRRPKPLIAILLEDAQLPAADEARHAHPRCDTLAPRFDRLSVMNEDVHRMSPQLRLRLSVSCGKIGRKMPHAGADGALHYEDVGHGDPIVFVPGFGGVGSFWRPQIEFFQPRFRVITLDQRGTGASARSRQPYSVDGMADDVEAVLEAARIETATVVGHSTGGVIAQLLAVRTPHRIARLVLSSTWSSPGPYLRRVFEFRRALLQIGATDLFHQAGVFFRYPPSYSETHDAAFDNAAEVDIDITIARIDAILGADLVDVTGRIDAPTMIVAARDDCLVPAFMSEEVARRMPKAKCVMFEQGGHFLPETCSGEYNAVLDEFLSQRGS